MLLSEARRIFKEAGYKIRTKSLSFGRHADVMNHKGEVMPCVFFNEEHRQEWLPAIKLKEEVYPVFDDKSSDKVYGFTKKTVDKIEKNI